MLAEARKAWELKKPLAQVLHDKSWKSADKVMYLPIYMISLLKPTALPEKMIYKN